MTKRQLIDEIVTLNHTAEPAFLARFEDEDLRQYLDHLQTFRRPRLSGDSSRYAKYFAAQAAPPASAAPAVTTDVDAAERAALLSPQLPADAPETLFSREPEASAQTANAEPVSQPPVSQPSVVESSLTESAITEPANAESAIESSDDETEDAPSPAAPLPATRHQTAAVRAASAWRDGHEPADADAAEASEPLSNPTFVDSSAGDEPADEEEPAANESYAPVNQNADEAEDLDLEPAREPNCEDLEPEPVADSAGEDAAAAESLDAEGEPVHALAAAPASATEESQSWLF